MGGLSLYGYCAHMSWSKQEQKWFEEEGEQIRLEAISKGLKEALSMLDEGEVI